MKAPNWSSDWFSIAIGVPQGCTASTIVFDLVFQLLLDIHESKAAHLAFSMRKANIVLLAPSYADDIALVTHTPKDNQLSIDAFKSALDWSITLRAKPAKCRSLAFKRFTSTDAHFIKRQSTLHSCFDPKLTIDNETICFIGDDIKQMFKYLGLFIQVDLKVDKICELVNGKITSWIKLIDSTLLTGPMKSWILNHGVLSKLSWILMIHEIPSSSLNAWHRLMTSKYKSWLGLAHSSETSVLYRSRAHFGLQLKDIKQFTRRLRVVQSHILKYSKDESIRKLYRWMLDRARFFRKLSPSLRKPPSVPKRRHALPPPLDLEQAERNLVFLRVKGNSQTSRRGLRYTPIRNILASTSSSKGHRQNVIDGMKSDAESRRLSILYAKDYMMQTQWLQFIDDVAAEDLTWSKILTNYSQRLLKFLLNMRANTLPSPDNMRRWDRKGNLSCGLCSQLHATLAHILRGCPWVRHQNKLGFEDRYTWCHNGVLVIIVNTLSKYLRDLQAKPRPKPRSKILFVKSGAKSHHSSPTYSGILDQAKDWRIDCDLPELHPKHHPYIIPHEAILTIKKPDIFIISEAIKTIILIELTCPDDVNMEQWGIDKKNYYSELSKSVGPNWTLHIYTVEVGAKGFVSKRTFFKTFLNLGFSPRLSRELLNNCSREAVRCSFVLWINRYNKNFDTHRLSRLSIVPSVWYNYRDSPIKTSSTSLPPPNLGYKKTSYAQSSH